MCEEISEGWLRGAFPELAAHELGGAHHRLQLPEGDLAGEVLHPAVGRDLQAVDRYVAECRPDALSDGGLVYATALTLASRNG